MTTSNPHETTNSSGQAPVLDTVPVSKTYPKIDPKNPPYPWIYPRFYKTILANAHRLQDYRILLYTVDNFLNNEECEYIINLINQNNRPATTIGSNKNDDKYYRTNSTCDLYKLNDDLINRLEKRMCDYVGLEYDYAEYMQGQYYKHEQEYKSHHDLITPGTIYYEENCKVRGQRTWTFMIYLNDVEEGGETKFKYINKTFYPKKGQGVIWLNSNDDGTPNFFTEHQGCPVLKGEKYIITKWFRERNSNDVPATLMLCRQLPVWTPPGFFKTRIPHPLYEFLKDIYYRGADRFELEIENQPGLDHVLHHYTKKPEATKSITHMIPLRDNEKKYVESIIQPQLESWVGQNLDMTYTYGIRVYTRGAILKPHVDRYKTHIISAILNISQEVEKPWPLVIQDHLCREHHIYLNPGEMLFYESSRLFHGRPFPLEGERFANLFVHSKPKFWDNYILNLDKDIKNALLQNKHTL